MLMTYTHLDCLYWATRAQTEAAWWAADAQRLMGKVEEAGRGHLSEFWLLRAAGAQRWAADYHAESRRWLDRAELAAAGVVVQLEYAR